MYLAQLLHCNSAVAITIEKFEGLLETLDILSGQLPVRAEPLCVLGHGDLRSGLRPRAGHHGSLSVSGCLTLTTNNNTQSSFSFPGPEQHSLTRSGRDGGKYSFPRTKFLVLILREETYLHCLQKALRKK